MARCDAIVLGAGIVGVSTALHLVKRGVSVALLDRREPGQETSYGNAGVIGGAGVYPTAFPRELAALLRIALKRAPEANYHLSALPGLLPWLLAYFHASSPQALEASARALRPLLKQAVSEHEALIAEAGVTRFFRKDGWISIYRTETGFRRMEPQLALCGELEMRAAVLGPEEARALEPSLAPIFWRAIHWPDVASLSNPVAVTRAYASHFAALGGFLLRGDARTLHRTDDRWRVDTAEGALDAREVVIALGPWSPDVLRPLGVDLPMAVKRGYHLHYRAAADAALKRPVLDAEKGYVLAPMQQGIRLTTGAEFAARDVPPTPVQIGRVLPHARVLFPLGEPVEEKPWMGLRPCFPDMRPAIGRVPRLPGVWVNTGHNHLGMSLGPASGRLLAEMMLGEPPFVDPAPYAPERLWA